MKFVLVFLGSGIGGIVRYVFASTIQKGWTNAFPMGTLLVNTTACLIIGILSGLAVKSGNYPESTRLLFAVGFCGGFSTFSTFTNETLGLWQTGNLMYLWLNIALSLLLCFSANFAGFYLAKSL